MYIASCKGSTNIGEDHCRCQEKKVRSKTVVKTVRQGESTAGSFVCEGCQGKGITNIPNGLFCKLNRYVLVLICKFFISYLCCRKNKKDARHQSGKFKFFYQNDSGLVMIKIDISFTLGCRTEDHIHLCSCRVKIEVLAQIAGLN